MYILYTVYIISHHIYTRSLTAHNLQNMTSILHTLCFNLFPSPLFALENNSEHVGAESERPSVLWMTELVF